MTPLYDIELEADRYEEARAYELAMWAKVGPASRGEIELSADEEQELRVFLCGIFHRDD